MTNSPAVLDAIDAALKPFSMRLGPQWDDCTGYWAQLQYAPFDGYLKAFPVGPMESPDELYATILDTARDCDSQSLTGENAVNIFSSDLFEYLAAEMLGGKNVTMTIKSVTQENIKGPRGEESKIIIRFVEKPKLWILNKTNARAIAVVLGSETNNWKGAKVTLTTERIKVKGEMVDALRVANVAKPGTNGTAPAKPPQVDELEPTAEQIADILAADPDEVDDQQEPLFATQGTGAYTN